jgi:PPE-repeat protein
MTTEPWGGYIPEINAGRYEAGTGPGTWTTAAESWLMYSTLVEEAMAILAGTMASVSLNWMGVTAMARDAAMAPFLGWLMEMAATAISNAMACAAVAEAYAAGNASMIPLPAVNANRIAEAIAVATNFMGCNTGLIIALNAQYAQFWGENGATMTTYDGAVQAATIIKPAMPPPPLTSALMSAADDAGQVAQAAANSGAQSGIQGATQAVDQAATQAATGTGNAGSEAMQAVMGPAQSVMGQASSLTQVPQQLMGQGQQLLSPLQSLFSGLGGGSSAGPASSLTGGLGTPFAGVPMGPVGAGGGIGGFGGAGGLGGGLVGLRGGANTGIQLAGSSDPLFGGVNKKALASAMSSTSGSGMAGAPMGGVGGGRGTSASQAISQKFIKSVHDDEEEHADDQIVSTADKLVDE